MVYSSAFMRLNSATVSAVFISVIKIHYAEIVHGAGNQKIKSAHLKKGVRLFAGKKGKEGTGRKLEVTHFFEC